MSISPKNKSSAKEKDAARVIMLAQHGLDCVIRHADARQFDIMDEDIKKLIKIINSRAFPAAKKDSFDAMAREAATQAYTKGIQELVKTYSDVEFDGSRQDRQDVIRQAYNYSSRAIAFGASASIKDRLDKIVEILEHTTKPGIDDYAKKGGISADRSYSLPK